MITPNTKEHAHAVTDTIGRWLEAHPGATIEVYRGTGRFAAQVVRLGRTEETVHGATVLDALAQLAQVIAMGGLP